MRIQTLIFTCTLSLFSFTAMAGPGHEHSHSHASVPVSQDDAKVIATKAVAALAEKRKIEKSWQSVRAEKAEQKTFKDNTEWVVTFNNSEISDATKRTLYVFLTLGGEYIAANHSGK